MTLQIKEIPCILSINLGWICKILNTLPGNLTDLMVIKNCGYGNRNSGDKNVYGNSYVLFYLSLIWEKHKLKALAFSHLAL